jgi:hypothetical protein
MCFGRKFWRWRVRKGGWRRLLAEKTLKDDEKHPV